MPGQWRVQHYRPPTTASVGRSTWTQQRQRRSARCLPLPSPCGLATGCAREGPRRAQGTDAGLVILRFASAMCDREGSRTGGRAGAEAGAEGGQRGRGAKRAEAGNCNLVLPDSNVHARSRPSSPSPVLPVETRSDAQDRSVGRGQGARRPGTPRGARAQDKSTMRAARCAQVRSTARAGVGALTIAHSRSSSSAIPSRLDVRARMPRRGRDRGLPDRARLATCAYAHAHPRSCAGPVCGEHRAGHLAQGLRMARSPRLRTRANMGTRPPLRYSRATYLSCQGPSGRATPTRSCSPPHSRPRIIYHEQRSNRHKKRSAGWPRRIPICTNAATGGLASRRPRRNQTRRTAYIATTPYSTAPPPWIEGPPPGGSNRLARPTLQRERPHPGRGRALRTGMYVPDRDLSALSLVYGTRGHQTALSLARVLSQPIRARGGTRPARASGASLPLSPLSPLHLPASGLRKTKNLDAGDGEPGLRVARSWVGL